MTSKQFHTISTREKMRLWESKNNFVELTDCVFNEVWVYFHAMRHFHQLEYWTQIFLYHAYTWFKGTRKS